MLNITFTITEVAYQINTHPRTILRWEQLGHIPIANKNYRGWRVYTSGDVEIIRGYKNKTREKK